MRKSLLPFLLLFGFSTTLLFSCVDDSYLANKQTMVADQSFTEEFDTVGHAFAKGWMPINASVPNVPTIWQQGGDVASPWFAPYSNKGGNVGFIGANAILDATNIDVICNWLVSPVVTMQNGDTISFYTRAFVTDLFTPGDSSDYGNRMLVRLNTMNEGVSVGSGVENGDFTIPLLDINPGYAVWAQSAPEPTAYPIGWTKFTVTVYGLAGPTRGRVGFKYLIEDGANYGSGVAIDKFEYKSINHK